MFLFVIVLLDDIAKEVISIWFKKLYNNSSNKLIRKNLGIFYVLIRSWVISVFNKYLTIFLKKQKQKIKIKSILFVFIKYYQAH